MNTVRFTLVAEGPSDRCLLRVISWAIRQHADRSLAIDPQFAEPISLPLAEKMRLASDAFPCDLLFVHRDADRASIEEREAEIAVAAAAAQLSAPVCVIPVRTTEAWLLFDESAIRSASDNPGGSCKLQIPRRSHLDTVADPKVVLRAALVDASEKRGRRLERFKRDLPERVQRVGQLIDDFSPLRALVAFKRFELATKRALSQVSG